MSNELEGRIWSVGHESFLFNDDHTDNQFSRRTIQSTNGPTGQPTSYEIYLPDTFARGSNSLTGQDEVKVFDSIAELSYSAAQMVTAIAQVATAAHGRFLIALSGGGTPAGLFRLLAQPPYSGQIPWTQTHIFWGDERLVPPDDSGSNYGQAAEILLKYISIPAANVHRAKGELAATTAVADYTSQLQQLAEPGRAWPRFDLAIMGLGSDGHTASLFPGPISELEQTKPVITVTADYDGRPAQRISLTPLVFNDSRHILFLVVGENKADAVTAVRLGSFNPQQWPAQRIQPKDGQLIWMLDEAAARMK